jgi:uncharacterized integral membrane protein
MNKRRLARGILISVAIGVLGFMFILQNQEVIAIDFFILDARQKTGVWIAAALILGFLLGYRNRTAISRVKEKRTAFGIRYESKTRLFGLPIVSIASGPNPEKNEDRGLAIGLIAIGDVSFGVLSFGGIAFGALSVGGASFGLASVGGMSIGILALGGAAIGLLAAVGGVAIGYNVVGEVGIGIHHFEEAHIYILDLLTF